MSVETNSVTPSRSITDIVRTILKPLASLKLTVALFGFAIAIILIGTFAQVDNDIWLVMEEYFKPFWIAHVPAKVLFPRTWLPDLSEEMAGQRLAGIIAALGFLSAGLVGANGKTRTGTIFLPGLILGYSGWLAVSNWLTNGFTFPGGALIGLLMFVNLAAAHALRYRIHARGTRLWSGLGTVATGLLLTYLIVTAGHDQEGLQGEPPIPLEQLWSFVKAGLSALACAEILYAFAAKPGQRASKTLRICSGAAGIILAVVSGWLWVTGDRTYIGPSAMRIVWQLIQGAAAGVILMIGAVLLYRRKAGVVVLHLGIGLMMFGQWFVSQYDVEQQITITEGETRAYAQDIRSLELAVIDSNNSEYAGKDDVRAIPLTKNAKTTEFANGATVQLDGLPFRIEVVEFLRNSRIEQGPSEKYADQIQGNGQRWHVDEMKAASGVKSDSVDLAAVYVRIKDDQDKDLGVYLLSQSQLFMRGGAELSFDAQRFDVAGQAYDIQLRFKRLYKPYEIKLIDVAKKDYLGTTMARAYESTISINGETDVRKIWMNNPLRFSGETFYQTNYFMDPFTGQETSTLQVVKNHGWMIPYVSCMISIIGMTYHFILTLANYKPVGSVSDVTLTSVQKWILPVVFGLLAASMFYKVASPKKLEPAAMDLAAAGRLPVIYQGRIKPWDTLARNNLRVLSERETFSGQLTDAQLLTEWPEIKKQISQKWSTLSEADLDGAVQQTTGEKYVGVAKLVELVTQKVDKPILDVESAVHKLTHERQPAIRWLMDMINDANQWQQHRVIRITDLEVLELLGMERRKGYRYSISEIAPQLEAFDAAVKEARSKDTAELSHYEKKLMDLA
ncbi:MAG: hypothetical protein KDA87_13240, partial [Planctomycetales bacterium]|nr:hypothetical protein [Planctomycetales bacterium]